MSNPVADPPSDGSGPGSSTGDSAAVSAVTVMYTGPGEQLDTTSTVPDDESEPTFGPQEAPSTASTQAPGDAPPRERHGRARNRHQPQWSPCDCPCRNIPDRHLGPFEPLGQRCACPMCGHRLIHGGHGCHFRVEVTQRIQGAVLCENCRRFCIRVLRWADGHYERTRQD